MPNLPAGVSRYEVREELNRILASRHFARAKKKSRFLEFLCEQALSGVSSAANEYAIGVDIFERGHDFDPQRDSIVRVQAHETRKSLLAYYEDDGKSDRLRIDLPAGGYVPVFTRINGESPLPAPPLLDLPSASLPVRRRPAWLLILVTLACASSAGWTLRGILLPGGSVVVPPRLPDEAKWFWRPFMPPAAPPLLVLPGALLLRPAHGGDSPAIWGKSQLVDKDKFPEFRDTVHFREMPEFRFVPTTTDFTGMGEALGLLRLSDFLGSAGQRFQVIAGHMVDYESIKRSNCVLLGGYQSWSSRVFVNPEGFEFHGGVIANKRPRPKELAVYRPEFDPVTGHLSRDYGLVLMLPNERKEERVLLLYGIYTQGTQAAMEFVTNPARLGELRKSLLESSADQKTLPKYFQALLTTTVENYVPSKVSLVSARAIPE